MWDDIGKIGLGMTMGAGIVYHIQWYYARKLEALIGGPRPLAKWDAYDIKADHASSTGRIVTDQRIGDQVV